MVLDGFHPLRFVPVSQRAFCVAHDEENPNALIFGVSPQLADVLCRWHFKKSVDWLDGIQSEGAPGDPGEVEGLDQIALNRAVQRPACQRDLEAWTLCYGL
jgi:hypothetical protein